jgi:hypothetical protein
MQGWNHQSLFLELIAKEDLVVKASGRHQRRAGVCVSDQVATLQAITRSLQRLQHSIVELDLEAYWVDALLSYLQRLEIPLPEQAPEDQFLQLYTLRRWLFWVPVSLLKCRGNKGSAILILAHFYAASIILEPLFPDLGASFCSALSLPALENIIQVAAVMRLDHGPGSAWSEIIMLMEFYQKATCASCSRILQKVPTRALQMNQVTYNFSLGQIHNTATSDFSLAYASLTPHHGSTASAPTSILCHSCLELLPPRIETSSIDYETSSSVAMPSFESSTNAYTCALSDEMGYEQSDASLFLDFRHNVC